MRGLAILGLAAVAFCWPFMTPGGKTAVAIVAILGATVIATIATGRL